MDCIQLRIKSKCFLVSTDIVEEYVIHFIESNFCFGSLSSPFALKFVLLKMGLRRGECWSLHKLSLLPDICFRWTYCSCGQLAIEWALLLDNVTQKLQILQEMRLLYWAWRKSFLLMPKKSEINFSCVIPYNYILSI